MLLVVRRNRWDSVTGTQLDYAIFIAVDVLSRVSCVNDQLSGFDNFTDVVRAMVRENDYTVVFRDFRWRSVYGIEQLSAQTERRHEWIIV
jgi:hypothetical protein